MDLQPLTGEFAGIATAALWAATSLCFTAAGKRVGSLPTNVIRLAIGVAMLSVFGWVVRGQLIPADATAHAWLWLSISGVLGMVICDLCLFESFLWIGPRMGMLMLTLAPPVATLTAWGILGEQPATQHWLGMAMVLGGVAWVVLERRVDADGRVHRHPVAGVLLGVLAAASQGVGMALSRHGMWVVTNGVRVDQCEPFAAAQIRELAGLVVMVVFFFLIRAWPRTVRALRDRGAMGFLSLGAFLGPFLGVAMSMVALKHAPVGVASTLIAMSPIFVLPMVVVFHREKLSLRAVAGALLAVAGVATLKINFGG
ncbi:hypothetical protein LCGC14_0432100 [marine sediment metagenome]|uniref:EamA domain-containing protein n=1 Tax=marine sediment metagenome TaxID=412755 RepID=A0A0F9SU41_9ZZZZ